MMVQFDVKRVQQGTESFMVSFDFGKTPITEIADYIIIAASKNNTSDIHFDPRENGMMVRFRIDGDLQDYTFIPKAYERNLATRLKLLANMNITETRLPQDGAIKGTFGDTYLDMRVSCLPLNEGEKIVIRILDYTRSLQGIDSLGFHPKNLDKLKRMMSIPNGIILVTGATGSGKSTTTYSILQGLNKPETNIITVEDPIEMNIQGINQVQVNAEIGMTFAAALRSILRQDPNVILIGEIRDSETAQIAVRASITGHLVLSTIHTNNSLSTIERLLDMDVERYLLSTALTGIISQRLAKQLCTNCRFQRETTMYEKKVFKKYMKKDVATLWDANPKGCEHCRKGYKGRIAIQEVLELDEDIRTAINNEKLEKEDLIKMVYTEKTITMLQDALEKAIQGLTSFEEVYRVIEIENEDGDNYGFELTKAITESEITPPTTSNDDLLEEDNKTTVQLPVPAVPNTTPTTSQIIPTPVKVPNPTNTTQQEQVLTKTNNEVTQKSKNIPQTPQIIAQPQIQPNPSTPQVTTAIQSVIPQINQTPQTNTQSNQNKPVVPTQIQLPMQSPTPVQSPQIPIPVQNIKTTPTQTPNTQSQQRVVPIISQKL